MQERGEIFFFYRPRVNREEAHSPDDVQRMYIVLSPESGEKPVEKKQSPDSGKEGAKSGKSPGSSHGEEKGEDEDENRRLKKHPEGGHGKEVISHAQAAPTIPTIFIKCWCMLWNMILHDRVETCLVVYRYFHSWTCMLCRK